MGLKVIWVEQWWLFYLLDIFTGPSDQWIIWTSEISVWAGPVQFLQAEILELKAKKTVIIMIIDELYLNQAIIASIGLVSWQYESAVKTKWCHPVSVYWPSLPR